ncbi:ATP-binding cassette domain-containing protein [Bacillus sp. JCM 19041]|uniref:ATP-binding cassette domain-containing protein n=1 Tax=Bacillus sp. JCM 19041 TaxID=1460637 RepID=UPI000AD611A5
MDVHNLAFSHRKGKTFIKEMNLSVRQGAITTIVGPNGSGKSTLLSLLANELSPDQGEVTLDANV